jgi:hypothetical protein
VVGNVANDPGRSLYVRLTGADSGGRAAGKWTDAATLEHGDLLDLIARNRRLDRLADVLDEARAFLSLPHSAPRNDERHRQSPAPHGSPESARRLYAMSQPIFSTIAEAYLRRRGITDLRRYDPLRFHPRCYYRPDAAGPTEMWPALIAAVTDLRGRLTGVHRTWLDPSGEDKAPIDTPRRSIGDILGHGIRFGVADETMAAGEGIETTLSLRMILPAMPMIAATSANHLAAILFPASLRRLYIARDADPAGDTAVARLTERAHEAGIEALPLSPALDDFNGDLRRLGIDALRASVRIQLAPEDAVRFISRVG